MLGQNVHSHLAQVHIGADASCRGNTGGLQHILNDPLGKFIGAQAAVFQIRCHIHKYFINGIDMDILRRHIFEVYFIYFSAVLHVMLHPGRRDNIIQFQRGISVQFGGIAAFPGEDTAGRSQPSQGVHFRHLLHHFKKPGAAGNSVSLQAGGYCQTNGLFRPGGIRYYQIGGQRIQFPLDALCRSIKRL